MLIVFKKRKQWKLDFIKTNFEEKFQVLWLHWEGHWILPEINGYSLELLNLSHENWFLAYCYFYSINLFEIYNGKLGDNLKILIYEFWFMIAFEIPTEMLDYNFCQYFVLTEFVFLSFCFIILTDGRQSAI